jgi:hypothetical protein
VLLEEFIRIRARVEAIEEFTERQGLLKPNGEPLPVLKLYIALLNAGGRGQARLDDYLQEVKAQEPSELETYLRETYGE